MALIKKAGDFRTPAFLMARIDRMKYSDLRDFINQLEKEGELKRITVEVDPYLEMTEICDRTLRSGGPALLFENVLLMMSLMCAVLLSTPPPKPIA